MKISYKTQDWLDPTHQEYIHKDKGDFILLASRTWFRPHYRLIYALKCCATELSELAVNAGLLDSDVDFHLELAKRALIRWAMSQVKMRPETVTYNGLRVGLDFRIPTGTVFMSPGTYIKLLDEGKIDGYLP